MNTQTTVLTEQRAYIVVLDNGQIMLTKTGKARYQDVAKKYGIRLDKPMIRDAFNQLSGLFLEMKIDEYVSEINEAIERHCAESVIDFQHIGILKGAIGLLKE